MTKQEIKKWIDAEVDRAAFDEPLNSAVKYVFSTGGKRLRPMMFLEAYKLSGKKIDDSVKAFAVAIECLHQYTLVHDDLPCMDNDDYRRGKPTCHKMFGEANAVLTGDALMNLAFTLMLKAAKDNPLVAKAAYEFSLLSGGAGVIGGQVEELNTANFKAQLSDIYDKKTSCLIWAAVLSGAIIGELNADTINALKEYCFNFGFAFQVYDDLMDLSEKGSVSDNSFVACYGVEKAVEEVKKRTENAINALVMSGINSEFFIELALKAAGRTE